MKNHGDMQAFRTGSQQIQVHAAGRSRTASKQERTWEAKFEEAPLPLFSKPSRNKQFQLFEKGQIRKPKQCKVLPLASKVADARLSPRSRADSGGVKFSE